MRRITIHRERCKGCQLCVKFCPKKNLLLDKTLNDGGVFPAKVISDEACTGCGICFLMCPETCIEIEG